MTAYPKITVVTPSLNQARYIEETILSVLSQQYPSFEYLVIDGGSTDQTLEILKKYRRLRWVSEPDRGQTQAINKGVRMSTGDVVAYLNADDVYRPGAFQVVADVFLGDPTTAVLVGDCEVIDPDSRLLGRYVARLDRFEDLLRYWRWGDRFCIPQPAVFIRRNLLEEAGLFDERFDLAMDYQMWLRLAAKYPFTVIHQALAAYRVTGETKTSRRRYEMSREEFRASRGFWHVAPWPERGMIAAAAVAHAMVHWC